MTRWCSIACVLEKGGTENERRSALMVYVSINHLGHFTGPGSAHSLQTRLKSTGAHSYKGICTLLSPKESQIWCIWAIKSVSLQNCHFLWYKSLGLSFPGRKIKGCLNLWAPWALPSASSRLAKSSEFLNISVLRCTVTPLHFSTEPVRMSTSLSTLVLSWLKNSSQGWEEEGKKKIKKIEIQIQLPRKASSSFRTIARTGSILCGDITKCLSSPGKLRKSLRGDCSFSMKVRRGTDPPAEDTDN